MAHAFDIAASSTGLKAGAMARVSKPVIGMMIIMMTTASAGRTRAS